MNKIGKMGRKNSKIPGQRMEIQKGLQKEVKQCRKLSTVRSRMKGQKRPQEERAQGEIKQYNELSAEDKDGLRNATLERYKEYINSDPQKKKQIILQILAKCRLGDNKSNRHWIAIYINNEKRKRDRDKISPEDKKKLKNKILEYYEIYNDPNCNREEKGRIISKILAESRLDDTKSNRYFITIFICNKNQKCKRDKIEISPEDKEKLKNRALQYYEVYVASKGDGEKIEQIILQILKDCELVDNIVNRWYITSSIANEKRKRESKKKKTPMPREKSEHYNKLPLLVLEEINGFIIENDLHTEYLEAENNRDKKTDIVNTILNKYKIKNCINNRSMIRRLILKQTFKPWSNEEEKALEELLREKINTAVWNESRDNNKIMQAKKQIMVKFKEQFPAGEHNEADIMYKMDLLVYHIKYTTQKPIESEQTKPVQQAISKVIGKEMRLDNADNKLNEQLNKQQTEEQDTISNVDKTYGIADTNETLPFFDDPFDDCENYPVL